MVELRGNGFIYSVVEIRRKCFFFSKILDKASAFSQQQKHNLPQTNFPSFHEPCCILKRNVQPLLRFIRVLCKRPVHSPNKPELGHLPRRPSQMLPIHRPSSRNGGFPRKTSGRILHPTVLQDDARKRDNHSRHGSRGPRILQQLRLQRVQKRVFIFKVFRV